MDDELPGVRAVRREDLTSRSASSPEPSSSPHPSSTAAAAAHFLAQLKQSYDIAGGDTKSGGFDRNDTHIATRDTPAVGGGEEDDGYEFRLFSAPKKQGTLAGSEDHVARRIAIRSPTPAQGEPGFVAPRRAEKYYFTGAISCEEAERFRVAAVSGEDVVRGLQTRWRGCELPWLVTVIKSGGQIARSVGDAEEGAAPKSEKRRRSGKKRRIAVRKKIQARDAKKIAALQSQAEKEAAEKEKRTRKNRERKVKKKRKEKLKKAGEAQEEE